MDEFERLLAALSKHQVLVYKSDGQGACEIVFKRAEDILGASEDDTKTTAAEKKTTEMESKDTTTIVGFNPKGVYANLPNLLDFE